jgi:hypothetical protein
MRPSTSRSDLPASTSLADTCKTIGIHLIKESNMAHTDNFWIGVMTLAIVGTMLVNAALVALT